MSTSLFLCNQSVSKKRNMAEITGRARRGIAIRLPINRKTVAVMLMNGQESDILFGRGASNKLTSRRRRDLFAEFGHPPTVNHFLPGLTKRPAGEEASCHEPRYLSQDDAFDPHLISSDTFQNHSWTSFCAATEICVLPQSCTYSYLPSLTSSRCTERGDQRTFVINYIWGYVEIEHNGKPCLSQTTINIVYWW